MGELARIFTPGLASQIGAVAWLSMKVSAAATLCATVVALPFAAWVALGRPRLRALLIVLMNAAMGLPSVVVGLLVYLLLSRAGPLGDLGMLFTPPAMVLAQSLLVAPLIAALSRHVLADADEEFGPYLHSLGLSTPRLIGSLIWESRFGLLVALLAGFGRAASEVGAVMIVGGNIDGLTRVMTTSIALETSKGELALALSLGAVLLLLVLAVNLAASLIASFAARKYA